MVSLLLLSWLLLSLLLSSLLLLSLLSLLLLLLLLLLPLSLLLLLLLLLLLFLLWSGLVLEVDVFIGRPESMPRALARSSWRASADNLCFVAAVSAVSPSVINQQPMNTS